VGKPEGVRPLGPSGHRCKDNIKRNCKEFRVCLDLIDPAHVGTSGRRL